MPWVEVKESWSSSVAWDASVYVFETPVVFQEISNEGVEL